MIERRGTIYRPIQEPWEHWEPLKVLGALSPGSIGSLQSPNGSVASSAKTARSLGANFKHPVCQLRMAHRVFTCGLGVKVYNTLDLKLAKSI
jgi:hypothetical protein